MEGLLAMGGILTVMYWLGRLADRLFNYPFHEGGSHHARVKKLNEYRNAFLKRQGLK